MNTSMRLIELLSWAAVEITKPAPHDIKKLSMAIDMALMEALQAEEREINTKSALLRTSQAMGL